MVGHRGDPKTPGFQQAGTDPKDSENVRRAFLAHVGMDHRAKTAALAAVGWTSSKTPKWIGDGNVPALWREKLWTYLGGRT